MLRGVGLEKVLSSAHIPYPAIFLYSPLSKAKLGEAQGNKAIHFHRIYHLLNRHSLCGQGVIYISSGWTQQLLAPNSTVGRPRRV